jgi:hypothetical protein
MIPPLPVNDYSIADKQLMSKVLRRIEPIWLPFVLLLFLVPVAAAQDITATIDINPAEKTANISGRFTGAGAEAQRKNLSLLREYAGISGLGARFSGVEVYDAAGSPVAQRRMIAGEYAADNAFRSWKYTVSLAPLADARSAAHVSWINDTVDVIAADDLLPQIGKNGVPVSARLSFGLPAGWRVFSPIVPSEDATFDVSNIEKAMFYIVTAGREPSTISSGKLRLMMIGDTGVTTDEASGIASEIFDGYARIFGERPPGTPFILVTAFPQTARPGTWEADTRGGAVTIVTAPMPFASQSAQRLHEQLRHELFHLWIPDGLELTGNYDWFYEGFAVYASLKYGVLSGRIRFDDYLDTLTRAYNVQNASIGNRSLLDASRERWTGSSTLIYARGMTVAFLYDVALLSASKGRRSVFDLLGMIYGKYKKGSGSRPGNEAVLSVLRAEAPGLERYIEQADKIDLYAAVLQAGLEPRVENSLTTLRVVADPNRRQKDLLDKLGYNSWRKLSAPSK